MRKPHELHERNLTKAVEGEAEMIEVEIKLSIGKKEELEKALENHGFLKEKCVREEDIYFNSLHHDFRKSDEALRIRRITDLDSGTEESFLTYKGPKLDQISMTRQELETGVENMETMRSILHALGYEKEYPVRKTRQHYVMQNVTACVDEVEGLGVYLELEVLVSAESEREMALEKIENILETLDHKISETTRTSYLSMLMKE